ncbi:protein kinase [Sulfuricurvum sp.]|uniref:protein kinase domain-containing protein n=1 Tax=Sulfuricurvum sp. TaxID=2025608 RepID=UPI002620DC1E|nr:protein kinase [Sulfuricurvum sp.]MDD2782261.1 protein kinase [Sulfuricurvum sp.]
MLSREYQIIETLHENAATVVYRARRISDNINVIVKMLKASEMREYRMMQMMNEQKLLHQLSFSYISNLLEVIATPTEYAHILEDVGGSSLHGQLLTRTFTIAETLYIALGVAEAMEYLHRREIIHADINPKNIIYNPITKAVQLIDFGYSFLDDRFKYNPDVHAGTSGNLMYMSPEQTGRTRQKIDFRSDLYSFGMTLYHLFSGEVPYSAEDRYELIHKQIALRLPNLAGKIEGFPTVLGEIVQKLIEKTPNLRYQNDKALIYDLKKALQSLQGDGVIEPFEIASLDRPSLLSVGNMYGRDIEITKLQALKERLPQGEQVCVTLSGTGGIGKTSLIQNFLNSLDTKTFCIAKGKFDQSKSIHPYVTLRDIFMQLKEMLTYKENIVKIAAISPHSLSVLASFFPVFNELGIQISPLKLSTDTYQQLPHALGELLRAVLSKECSLVIVLDDLHWADRGSLVLLQKSIIDEDIAYVHLLLIYREKELEKNLHAKLLMEHLLQKDQSHILSIALEPLRKEDYTQMLQEWFSDDFGAESDLVKLFYKKTLGNPFYFKLLLENLLDNGAISFEHGAWKADRERIRHTSASEDRNELIGMHLGRLSTAARDMLSILSLLGNTTEAKITKTVLKSMKYPLDLLDQLDREGLIDITHHKYHFVHDLLFEYVYKTIPSDQKIKFKMLIGKDLYRQYRLGMYHDVVQLSYFLNESYQNTKRLLPLHRLNLEALSIMLRTHEYTYALKRLIWMEKSGMDSVLHESSRYKSEYGVLRFKILYLNGLHDQASSQIERLISEAKNIDENIICFALLKDLCVTQGEGFERAAAFGEQVLKRLGLAMDLSTLENTIQRLKVRIETHSLSQNSQKMVTLPMMNHPMKKQIVEMLVEYWESVYYLADLPRMQWAYLNIIDLSFKYGNTSGSAFGYVLYGAGLISQHHYKEAYRFGDAAIKINHRFADASMLPKIYNFMANFISPYTKGVTANSALYQKSLHQSKINGDIVFGTWANYLLHFSQFFSGRALDELRTDMEDESGWLLHSKDQKMIAIYRILHQTVEGYQHTKNENRFDELGAIALWEEEQFYPGLAWYGIIKAQAYWFSGDFDEALSYLKRYVRIESNEVIMFPKQYFHIFRALILLGKPEALSEDEVLLLEHDLNECDSYAKASVRPFKFWRLLIRAKSARGAKNIWDVAKYFEEAIHEARQQHNSMYIAISALCSARFWKLKGYSDMSRFYFSEASIGFNQWGAYALSATLCPELPVSYEKETGSSSIENSSSSSLLRAEPANYRALLKSIYTLSQAVGKNELLENLMQMILQNATASKAVLVIQEGQQYYVKASMALQESRINLHHQKLNESFLVPNHIINHTITTEHKVTLNAPAENGQFQYDEYFKLHHPASCSAFSASIEGEVRAVLYLENDEITTPLSEETIQTLRLLLTQSAIIYKNASLYEMLQTNEHNLNKAQQISHVGSYQYNMTADELVWSAETYRIFELEPFSMEISQEWVMSHIHPDDLSKLLDEQEKILGGQPYCNIMNRIITAKGNVRSVHQRAEIYWEENQLKISGTIQDITEAQHSEAKIKMLSQVVNQTPFSIILTDATGKIEYANNQALSMSGYFLHELIGKKMSLLSSDTHTAAFYTQLWETIANQRQSWRGTIVNRMKTGVLRDCESTIFPIIGTHGEIINFVTIQDDVTEQNLKDRLFLMQTRQAQMGEMLSMIAHQWRQPLAIMSALIARQKLNILLEKATYEDIGQNFNEMEVQIQHLSRTITDFKDFFKPDKQTSLTNSTLIVTKALELIEHAILTHGIALEKNFADTTEFRTYESELIQVVLNLIKNSLDAFDEKLLVHPKIILTTANEGLNTIIQIEDNAGGISEEVLETLFSPYVSTKSENGTGLGLYMSKIILEEHCHGSIVATNTSHGACFTLTFPKNNLD